MIMEDNTSFHSIEVGFSHLSRAFFLNPRLRRHQRTKFELEKNDATSLPSQEYRDNDIIGASRSGLNLQRSS